MVLPLAAALTGFILVAQTPRADYYTLDKHLGVDVKACEKFVEKTERLLGVVLPHFEYYRVRDVGDVFRFSRDHHYAAGVANAEPLYAIDVLACDKHELAHLCTYQIGRGTPVFDEGLAGYLADDYLWDERPFAKHEGRHLELRYERVNVLFRNYSGSTANLHVQYLVSEEFVRHLVGHGGLATLVRIVCRHDDEAFRQAYGGSPSEVFDRWLYGKKAAPR
ncbi:MAG TPA: hypothetical protein VMJ72_01835 [Candidatus Paceibacterota bacterium]|nr:hypothetical protein [Candidatus Paceibacterota bacterium]